MSIITVDYRFLRLNSQTLALVEIYPDSNIPEVCQELYLQHPYLSIERWRLVNSTLKPKQLEKWKKDIHSAFTVAVKIAKSYSIIDYLDKLKTEEREVVLWKILDPLTYWDEFVPLFDNEFNLILR